MLRMELADYVRWAAAAARGGRTLAEFCREAMNEKAKRENGERGVAPVQNRPQDGPVSAPVRTVSAAGVGRLDGVSSGEFVSDRERARMLAARDGRCTADTTRGSRCKLCGQVHR